MMPKKKREKKKREKIHFIKRSFREGNSAKLDSRTLKELNPEDRYLPLLALADEVKPILDAMDLKGKSIERKIIDLAAAATLPKHFANISAEGSREWDISKVVGTLDKKDFIDEEHYGSTGASLPILVDHSNCRNMALTFSALLSAAGIEHEIHGSPSAPGFHPKVLITDKRVKHDNDVWVDFNGHVNPGSKDSPQHRTHLTYANIKVFKDGRGTSWEIYESGNELEYMPRFTENKLKNFPKRDIYKNGFHKAIIERAIELEDVRRKNTLRKNKLKEKSRD